MEGFYITELLDEVLLANKVQYEWKILVVDEFAMKVVSSCFKTEEIMACNIACMLCFCNGR